MFLFIRAVIIILLTLLAMAIILLALVCWALVAYASRRDYYLEKDYRVKKL